MQREEYELESARYRRRDQCGRATHIVSRTTSNAVGIAVSSEQPRHVHHLQAVPAEHQFPDAFHSSRLPPLPLTSDRDTYGAGEACVSLNVQAYVGDRVTNIEDWLRDSDVQQPPVVDRQDDNFSACPTTMEEPWKNTSLFPELDLPYLSTPVTCDNCNAVQSFDCDVVASRDDATVAIQTYGMTDKPDNNNNDVATVNANVITKEVVVMIDAETQTTVADIGVLVQEAATQAGINSGNFICQTDPSQVVECLSDLMQGDTVSTPFMLARTVARKLHVAFSDIFERSVIAALSYGMSFFECRFMNQLVNMLRPLHAVDATERTVMLALAYELTRRQNRPQDAPGTSVNFDSPPDTAAAAGVDDRAPMDPIIIDSDTEPVAESEVVP